MAVIDKEGKWKAFYSGKELPGVINVFSLGAKTSSKPQTWLIIPAGKNSILESAKANLATPDAVPAASTASLYLSILRFQSELKARN